MPDRNYHTAISQLIHEMWSKGDEARINENLASICRELDHMLPRLKESTEHGAALTQQETDRLRQLNDAYNANIERYKSLKGFK
jgi:cob(I)alamin adenosyltransferase